MIDGGGERAKHQCVKGFAPCATAHDKKDANKKVLCSMADIPLLSVDVNPCLVC